MLSGCSVPGAGVHPPIGIAAAPSSWGALGASQGSRQRGSGKSRSQLTIAGNLVAPLDETKHFKLIGTTGTGKSTAIRELITAALRRGDRAIITDPDGGYQARLYRRHRGDIVLNPFEPDSVRLGSVRRDPATLSTSISSQAP